MPGNYSKLGSPTSKLKKHSYLCKNLLPYFYIGGLQRQGGQNYLFLNNKTRFSKINFLFSNLSLFKHGLDARLGNALIQDGEAVVN